MSIDSSTEESSIDMKRFGELLNYQPVPTEKEKPTLFDISGYPHYENVISNWYKFFLDADKPHGFGNLFYLSLLELLDPKGKEDRRGNSCEVEREEGTDERGRIDLLVFEEKDECGKFQHPIIIENKIYADLAHNDLGDYYRSIKKKSRHTPKKLVLSLYGNEDEGNNAISKKVKEYKVCSHDEYMEVIKKNLHSYIVGADPKYFMLLQDFISNIEKKTKPAKMDANSKYYFSNAADIAQLLEMKPATLKEYFPDATRTDRLVKMISPARKVVICNFSRAISYKQGWKRLGSNSKLGDMNFEITAMQVSFYVSLSGLKYTVTLTTWGELREHWNIEPEKNALLKVLLDRVSGTLQECNEPHVVRQVEYDIRKSDEGDDIDKALDEYHDLIIKKIKKEWMPFVEKLQAINDK